MSQPTPTAPISAQQRPIGRILAEWAKLRVPTYQRDYSWTAIQINEFWEDIAPILDGSRDSYFLGPLVFIKTTEGEIEVVDGQQRLACASLLLAAIRDTLKEANEIDRSNLIDQPFLCRRDFRSLDASPKLIMNENDNAIYARIIQSSVNLEEMRKFTQDQKSLLSH